MYSCWRFHCYVSVFLIIGYRVCFLCATFWLFVFCVSERKMDSLNNNHSIFPFQPMSNSAFSCSVYGLSWGESTEWKGSSVFLAKTPTSFRRPYVWSARIVLQERLRRLMIFAKLKPLVSYMIIPKTHVAAVLDWTLPFYGEMQEICTVCVNIYICVCVCVYIYMQVLVI